MHDGCSIKNNQRKYYVRVMEMMSGDSSDAGGYGY